MHSSGPEWRALQRSISGDVLLPGAPDYEWARRSFIARFDDIEPQAVVRCCEADDAVQVVAFARRHGIATAIRSGGHSLAGYSSTPGILIDVMPLREVVVADGLAVVGAGARIGELNERLAAHGLALPVGTCPSVGIAGLTLGGGVGVLGRLYGLTLDRLVQVQVVLADGSVVTCDDDREGDLFWALRGAGGGNFGVVTSLAFLPVSAPVMANFHLAWSPADAAPVIDAWQRWATSAPDELSADLALSAGRYGAATRLEVFGAMVGSAGDATGLLEALVTRAGSDPLSTSISELSYAQTAALQADLTATYDQIDQTPTGRVSRQGCRFTRSELFDRLLPAEAIAALVEQFDNERGPGQDRSLSFAPWGRAHNRPRPDATAFVHRGKLYSLEHVAAVGPEAPVEDKCAAHRWAERSWRSVRPWGSSSVYPNFPDPDLEDWQSAYYGANYAKLRRVKARYDPDAFFRFQQSIPPLSRT